MTTLTNSDAQRRSAAKFYKLHAELAAREDLTAADKLLLAIITNEARATGIYSDGIRLLAKAGHFSAATVSTSLRRLAATGDLAIEQGGNGQANRYRVTSIAPVGRSTTERSEPERSDIERSESSALALKSPSAPSLVGKKKKSSKKKTRPAAPATDPRVNQALGDFCAQFKDVRGHRYRVIPGKDGKLLKVLLRDLDADETVDDPVATIASGIANLLGDARYGRENASVGVLCGQWNRWRGDTLDHGVEKAAEGGW